MSLVETISFPVGQFYALFDPVDRALSLIRDLPADWSDEKIKQTIHRNIALIISQLYKAISPLQTIHLLEEAMNLRSKDKKANRQFIEDDAQSQAILLGKLNAVRKNIGIMAAQPSSAITSQEKGPWAIVWGTGDCAGWNMSARMTPLDNNGKNEGALKIFLAHIFDTDPLFSPATFFLIPFASVSRLQGITVPKGYVTGEYRTIADSRQVAIPPSVLLRDHKLPLIRFEK